MATLTLPQALHSKLTTGALRTGLVLGFQTEQKYFGLSLAPTPPASLAPATSLEALLAAPLTDNPDTNYCDWVIEHARQTQRLLPAGLAVLGLFAASPDEALQDFKSRPPVLRTLLSLCEDMNKEVTRRDSVLLLHFSSERQKWAGRAVDSKDSRVNVVEVKAGAPPRLEEIRGIYKLDTHFSDQSMTVREGVEKIVTNVASKLNIDRVLISHKSEGPLPPLKSESDCHQLEVLSTAISSHLSHCCPPKTQISVSGAIETRSYVLAKTAVPLAAEAVRSDIVQSLRYRLSLYCEGEGEKVFAQRPAECKTGTYGLPCRVFYRSDTGVALCDYLSEGETKEQSHQRVSDLTGFTGLSEGESAEQLSKTVRVDTEVASEAHSPLIAPRSVFPATHSPPYWLYAVAALVFAMLLRLILS